MPCTVSKSMWAVKLCTKKNPPVLNCMCRLTQVGLYNGRKTVVAAVVVVYAPLTTKIISETSLQLQRAFSNCAVLATLTNTRVSTCRCSGGAVFLLVQLLSQLTDLVAEVSDDVGVLRYVQRHIQHVLADLRPHPVIQFIYFASAAVAADSSHCIIIRFVD